MKYIPVYRFHELDTDAREVALSNYPSEWLAREMEEDNQSIRSGVASLMENVGFSDIQIGYDRTNGYTVSCTINAEDLRNMSAEIVIEERFHYDNLRLEYDGFSFVGAQHWLPKDVDEVEKTESAIIGILMKYLNEVERQEKDCAAYRVSEAHKVNMYQINEVHFFADGRVFQ